jgi:hypothetical protein
MVSSAQSTDITGCHPGAKNPYAQVSAELAWDDPNVKMPATNTGELRRGHGSRVLYGLSADAFTVYYQSTESIRKIRKINAKWMSVIANCATDVHVVGSRSHIVVALDENQFTEKIPISAGI